MKKLTDEELSRVLGLSDTGELDYWGTCLAIGALALTGMPAFSDIYESPESARAWELSNRASLMNDDLAGSPDSVLQFLESLGLA